jgi:hypothetical protein
MGYDISDYFKCYNNADFTKVNNGIFNSTVCHHLSNLSTIVKTVHTCEMLLFSLVTADIKQYKSGNSHSQNKLYDNIFIFNSIK